MDALDRARGVLGGLACGDALGRPVEFKEPQWISQKYGVVDEMIGDGSHRQPAGTITDDTQQALCIAGSLAELGRFDPDDIANRFVEWFQSDPFDIGMMTAEVLGQINRGTAWAEASRLVFTNRIEGQNAGNGSVMRCAPIALAYHDSPDRLVEVSRASSEITHYDMRCQYGCAVLNLTIANCLHGEDNPLQLALRQLPDEASLEADELLEALHPVPDSIEASDLDNGGFVVKTLQAGLYYALTAPSAKQAIVRAVNGGGDTDTIAAVTGALVGAKFGADSLPDPWINNLRGIDRETLETLAIELFENNYE